MWAPGPVWTGAESLVSTGIRSLDRPVSSESLYQLSYPGPRDSGNVDVLTSALDVGEWLASSPGRFNPKERRYPFNRRMHGSYGMDVPENTKVSLFESL